MNFPELVFSITAYAVGCDVLPGSKTSSGTVPEVNWTVAADPKVLKSGSIVFIDGLGIRRVEDTGPAIKGLELDLYVESCEVAHKWERRNRKVVIIYDRERDKNILSRR